MDCVIYYYGRCNDMFIHTRIVGSKDTCIYNKCKDVEEQLYNYTDILLFIKKILQVSEMSVLLGIL